MKVLIELISINLKEIRRDIMSIFWNLLFPVMFCLIFGAIYTNINLDQGDSKKTEEVKPQQTITVDVGLVNNSDDSTNAFIEESLKKISLFHVVEGNQEDELKAFMEGKRNIVIILPDHLSKTLSKDKLTDVVIYHDYMGTVMLYGVAEVFQMAERQFNNTNPIFEMKFYNSYTGYGPEVKDLIKEEKKVEIQNPLKPIDNILPGMLALTIMQLGLFGTSKIISMRNSKILKSLGVTPLSRTIFLLSEVIVRLILAAIQALIIIIIGHYILGVTLSSSWFVIFGWVLLGTLTFIAVGYMITTFAKTADSGNALMQVVHLPMMFLSGIFITKDMMPAFLQKVVDVNPLAYLADGFRSAMVGCEPVYGYYKDVSILLIVLSVSFVIALRRFKWE